MPKRRTYKWQVEFEVDESWVADGFNLDNERAKDMIENLVPYAYSHETAARVIKAPSPKAILKARGYEAKESLTDYPILSSRGAAIVGDPPGISPSEIYRILSPNEIANFSCWSTGITCGPYGVYPWDLEDFLSGRPNLD